LQQDVRQGQADQFKSDVSTQQRKQTNLSFFQSDERRNRSEEPNENNLQRNQAPKQSQFKNRMMNEYDD